MLVLKLSKDFCRDSRILKVVDIYILHAIFASIFRGGKAREGSGKLVVSGDKLRDGAELRNNHGIFGLRFWSLDKAVNIGLAGSVSARMVFTERSIFYHSPLNGRGQRTRKHDRA